MFSRIVLAGGLSKIFNDIFIFLRYNMAESNKKELFMECAKIEVTVPKEMQVYFSDGYAVDSGEELKRNALLLYPYIHSNVISHGRAAEILGVKKLDLIELYDNMGFPYFDMDIGEVLQDIQTFRSIKKDWLFRTLSFQRSRPKTRLPLFVILEGILANSFTSNC